MMLIRQALDSDNLIQNHLKEHKQNENDKQNRRALRDLSTVVLSSAFVAAGALAVIYSEYWVPQIKGFLHVNGMNIFG